MGRMKLLKPLAFDVRGIRNHNPGNVIWNGTEWEGLAECKHDGKFCVFVSPEYGIRAMVRILRSYSKQKGLPGYGAANIDTVYEIIMRWAPPSENETNRYVWRLASYCGINPGEPFNVFLPKTMRRVIKGIIREENGCQPYSDALIDRAIEMESPVL